MILEIDEIPIYFPYEKIYPEQLKYIKHLLKSLKDPGPVLIEMPSGTGKTISLLSCTVSYLLYCRSQNKPFKIIYCSRTIPEIDKTLNELKKLIEYIKKNVVITSGTLSPINMYPKILNFVPSSILDIGATLERNSICPLIITKGNDQMLLKTEEQVDINEFAKNTTENKIHSVNNESNHLSSIDKFTTSFKYRIDPSVIRNYGSLIINLSITVPDNLVVFFPSYIYMEEVNSLWSELNIMNEILNNKLIYIETPDFQETELALKNFRNACDSGRGAVLFSVARGKVSEGVDFEHGYGRAVVMLGIPFMYSESIRLKEKLKYIRQENGIKEYDFLVFDAMRHTAQCLGRVLRNKTDYGLMIMAVSRFVLPNKVSKMPKWIQERIEPGNTGLSVDMALSIAKTYYKEI